jgi:uncharacterized protein involved in exopolysaccharide biosynthesis
MHHERGEDLSSDARIDTPGGLAGEYPEITIRGDRTGLPAGTLPPQVRSLKSEEISVRELYGLLARQKWLIISLTAAVSIAALVAALILPKQYRATAVLAPVAENSSAGSVGSLSGMLSQIGGLASLVGLSSRTNQDEAEDVATLESESLTQRYIRDNNLLPILFAKDWNARTGNWRTTDPRDVPTLWKANRFFQLKVRSVTEDTKTGLIRVTITWTDPRLAAQWANGIVDVTNDYLRNKAIQEADRDIAYLEGQAQQTPILEVKQGVYTLIQQEIASAMIAQGKREYALKVIDPAFAPERPSSPLPYLWTLGGFICGLFVSLGAVILRASWNASS